MECIFCRDLIIVFGFVWIIISTHFYILQFHSTPPVPSVENNISCSTSTMEEERTFIHHPKRWIRHMNPVKRACSINTFRRQNQCEPDPAPLTLSTG